MARRDHSRKKFELPERLPPASLPALSRDEFYARHPAARFMAQLEERTRPGPSLLPIWLSGTALAAATALLILVAGPGTIGNDTLTRPPRNPVRPKVFGAAGTLTDKGALPASAVQYSVPAEADLRFEVLDGRRFSDLKDGSLLHSGDILRFHYDSGENEYLYLFSVDNGGIITTYYPENRVYSVPIVRGRNIPLQDGVRLDSYVGDERFYALFSDRPIGYPEVDVAVRSSLLPLQAAELGVRALGNLPLKCRQVTLWIEKR
jgi:hypothetical protein